MVDRDSIISRRAGEVSGCWAAWYSCDQDIESLIDIRMKLREILVRPMGLDPTNSGFDAGHHRITVILELGRLASSGIIKGLFWYSLRETKRHLVFELEEDAISFRIFIESGMIEHDS